LKWLPSGAVVVGGLNEQDVPREVWRSRGSGAAPRGAGTGSSWSSSLPLSSVSRSVVLKFSQCTAVLESSACNDV